MEPRHNVNELGNLVEEAFIWKRRRQPSKQAVSHGKGRSSIPETSQRVLETLDRKLT